MHPGARFYSENIEGLRHLNIPQRFWEDRQPGLSAMIRLKDEAEWIVPSLDSIAGWCDEIVICLQGEQHDGTDRLVAEWAVGRHNVTIHRYPFDSVANGVGHDQQQRGSVYERAYFYNWSLARTTRSHVMKWDGDMVAFEWLGDMVRRAIGEGHELVRYRGTDICGTGLRHTSLSPHTACEVRVFEVTPASWYFTGPRTEYFTRLHEPAYLIQSPAFLHFKWAKDLASATKAWPEDWREREDRMEVYRRKAQPGEAYAGPWPSALADRVAACV